ncbi:MAG: amidohydrolase family protein [Longimicrobiales bacterium]
MDRRDAIRTAAGVTAGLLAGVQGLAGQDRPAPAAGRGQEAELLIRGGRIVNADGSRDADVRVVGARIAEIGADLRPGPGARVVDATGHRVLPGGIDPHAHLQGGFVDDLTTGTAAAVAGGITTVGTFAYPRDGETPVDAMDRSIAEADATAIGDVFFHASSWPPTPAFAAMMPDLAARGQPSHKVFMTRADFAEHRGALTRVLHAARDAGVVTLVHCEDAGLLASALARLEAAGNTDLRWFAESRPVEAEVVATRDAVALCAETRAPMHLVHLSSGASLDAARDPALGDIPLSIETRPLYLYFTEEWLRGPDGPLYVGQPPLRPAADVLAMWAGLSDGRIDMLATDHAPWTRAQKMDPALHVGRLRPGVSDLRFVRPVLWSEGVARGRITEERFVEVTATAAARTFGLFPERGVIREGALADLMILDPDRIHVVDASDDPSRSDYTPFQGWALRGWPVMTVRRGQVVFEGGRVTGQPGSGQAAIRTPRR